MVNLDFSYSSKKEKDLYEYEKEINDIVSRFKKLELTGCDFAGWFEYPVAISDDLLEDINKTAEEIRRKSDVFVICGIGGSYLGARAVIEAINDFKKQDVEIIYLGNTFDEKYTKSVLEYLEQKDFCVNVISKSGSTMETAIAFEFLKSLLKRKYGRGAFERIYVTTDKEDGVLRAECKEKGYKSYVIPKDVGGRYSVFTPVGLLPIAVANIDIYKFVKGAQAFYKSFESDSVQENMAYQYAAYRNLQYRSGRTVELFASYSPNLIFFAEWWKQLFGESEGKEGKGLFPASVNFSADLHSLGQYVQQGNKILFITQIKNLEKGQLKLGVNNGNLGLLDGYTLGEVNRAAQEGVNRAHFEIGGVDNLSLVVDELDEYWIGYLMFFFMCSCMISAYLLQINPFDQPGVEFYKSEMKKILKKEIKL